MEAQLVEQRSEWQVPGMQMGRLQRRPRVLVVEDDGDMRRLVAKVLERDGYEVHQMDDGVGLLSCIEATAWGEHSGCFDVIVSDVQMPDLTALEVLEALRYRDLPAPIVLMTAYGNDQTRSVARALGAAAVLDKPIDWHHLRAAVKRALALG